MSTASVQQSELVEQHQRLLYSLANGISRKLPRHIDLEDLVSYGQLGLIEAAQDFDAQKGVSFATFAYYRIRGAIYEGASKLQGTSRAQYKKLKMAQAANQVIEEHATQAVPGENLGSGWQAQQLGDLVERLAASYVTGKCAGFGGQEDALEDPQAVPPEDTVAWQETCTHLHRLIAELPEEAAFLVKSTFFEGRTLQDAATEVGLSKSWASRLLSRSLEQLARGLRRVGAGE